jgi:cytochrome P450
MYLVTAHELVQQILQDATTFSSKFYEILSSGSAPNPEAAAIYAQGWPEIDVVLTSDPPEHRRFRSLLTPAFGPRRITLMEPQIRSAIDLLIDRFIDRGECDFIREFAVPLPTYMICDMLGIDRSLVQTVWRWSDAYILRNGQMGTKQQEVEAARSIVECQHFLNDMIQARREVPANDIVSDLVHGRAEGVEPLTDLEILSTLQILVIGGNETTRNALIGMMGNLLGPFRDQYELLRQDPSLMRNAVEEILRLHTPIGTTWRVATRDVTLRGVQVSKGATLMCRLDAGNHDRATFENPEKLDVRRPNAIRHLAFGTGIHTCIGNVLAKRELNLALPRLMERLGDMRIVTDKTDLGIRPSVLIRAINRLQIAFEGGGKIQH